MAKKKPPAKKAAKVGKLVKAAAPQWTTNTFGATWGDLEIVRVASSREGDRRRWVTLDVIGANGSRLTITATPRTTTMNETGTRTRGGGK